MNLALPASLTWLLNHSWQAGILVPLVLLAQWIFRRRLTNRWRFALWWIVLLRLLLPFGPESALSLFNVVRPAVRLPSSNPPAPVTIAPSAQSDLTKNAPLAETILEGDGHALPDPNPATPPVAAPVFPPVANSPPPIPWSHWLVPGLAALWLAGVVVLAGLVGLQIFRFYRKLARAANPADIPLGQLLEECRGEFQVRRPIELLETDAVQSPALFGFFRLRLLLPRGIERQFGRAELRYIFLHELAHVKRGDVWLNWLITGLQILHWFNPLLWLGFARLRADRELACDELALLRAGDQAGTAYGETVVKLLEHLSRPTAIPGLVGILEDARQMRRRIAMIANFQRPGRWSVLAVLLLAALAAAALTDAQSDKPAAPRTSVEDQTINYAANSGSLKYDPFHNPLVVQENSYPWVAPPGATVMTNLGGTGRTVIGRLRVAVLYPDEPPITNFSQFSLHLVSTNLNDLATEAHLHPDGSFSANDVPAGQYGLELTKSENWGTTNRVKIYNSYQKLMVPPDEGCPENPVVDWGAVGILSPKILIPGAGVKGIVLAPDGTRAAGAEVALQLQVAGKWFGLGPKGFEPAGLREDGLLVGAGPDGSFTLPLYEGAKSVIARNEQGFAQVSLEQLRRSPQIILQPWGRIEGILSVGHHLGTNELVGVAMRHEWSAPHSPKADGSATDSAELEPPDFLPESLQSKTDDQGHFVITQVPPGLQTLCWLAPLGPNGWSSRPLAVVDVQPGATVVTNVGSKGRTIRGRVKFSGGQPRDWISATVDLMSPSPESRERRQRLKTDAERRAFDQSPEVQASKNNPRDYVIPVQPDGSFRADEVDAGEYGFLCNVHTRSGDNFPYPASRNYFSSEEVVVPAANGENDESVVDLGEVEVAKLERPMPSAQTAQASAAISVTTGPTAQGASQEDRGALRTSTNVNSIGEKVAGPTGRVVTPEGQPVAGVTVVLLNDDLNEATLDSEGRLSTFFTSQANIETTGPGGNFAFAPAGGIKFIAAASPHGFALVRMAAFATNLVITLDPLGTITGTLTRPYGPGTNEELELSFVEQEATRQAPIRLTHLGRTDSAGRFRFDHVPPGFLKIWKRIPGNQMPDTEEDLQNVFLDPGVSTRVNIHVAPSPDAIPGPEVKGIVLRPDGTVEPDARVALQVEGKAFWLGKEAYVRGGQEILGNLYFEGDSHFNTGPNGRFSLPLENGAQSIAALSTEGYAQVPLAQVQQSGQITLQKWGRIEGVLHNGHELGTNQSVFISPLASAWASWHIPNLLRPPLYDSRGFQTITDDQGRFVFTNVPPGRQILYRRTQGGRGTAPHWFEDNQLAIVDVAPGATVVPHVGGTGRTVMGRLKFSAGETPDFTNGFLTLGDFPTFEFNAKMRLAKTGAERQALAETKAFQLLAENTRKYAPDWQPDGSFRAEEVTPGRYELHLLGWGNFNWSDPGNPTNRVDTFDSDQELIVPPTTNDQDESVVDLGDIDMRKWVQTLPATNRGEPSAARF
jgi:beta-lactamase regulating signal transducer with metallopeptidase domain